MRDINSGWRDDELVMLKDAASKFFKHEFLPLDEQWQKNGAVDRDAWNKAGEMGLLCASIPTAFGGGGGSFAHEAVLIEAQGELGISSFGNAVHSGIVAHYINAYGSEEQKRGWLPAMASGEIVTAVCMTEPGTGSDLQAVKTTASREADEYVINGSKTFITNGHWADLLVVVTTTDATKRAKGISLLVVETDKVNGFKRGRNLEKIGSKGLDTAELFFDDVRVPVSNLLGGIEGQGFYQLMNQLPQERLIIGLQAVVGMELAVRITTEYVKERKAFGGTLMDLQNTRMVLAAAKTKAHVGRVFIDRCIQQHLDGQLDSATASMSKYWCSQAYCEVVDDCLQLHGGYGYMKEYPIARMFCDARVLKIYGGANEVLKELIARTL